MNRQPSSRTHGRQAWRQSTLTPSRRNGPSRSLRWFASLGLLALLGLLVYLILPLIWFRPLHTQLVTVTAGATNYLTVPSLLFARQDVQPIARIAAIARSNRMDLLSWDNLLEGQQLTTLGRELQNLPAQPHARIVLIQAHATVDQGQPVLLARDFDLDQPTAAVPVSQLLQEIPWNDRRPTIVVLDTAYVATDPRLGILLNAFPHSLPDTIAKLPPLANAWIWLSAAPGELAQIEPAAGQSLFATTLAQGLAGQADQAPTGNTDRHVDLHELVAYVQSGCRSRSGDTQHPLLYRLGQPQPLTLDQTPDTRLVQLDRQWLTNPAIPPNSTTPSSTPPNTTTANPPTSNPPTANTSDTSTTSPSSTAPAAATPAATSPSGAGPASSAPLPSTPGTTSPPATTPPATSPPATTPPTTTTTATAPPTTTAPATGPPTNAPDATAPATNGTALAATTATTAGPTVPPLPSPLPTDPRQLLDLAWQLRDQLHTPAPSSWTLPELALPLSHELNRWLVEYEYQMQAAPTPHTNGPHTATTPPTATPASTSAAAPSAGSSPSRPASADDSHSRLATDLTQAVRDLHALRTELSMPNAGANALVAGSRSSVVQRLRDYVRQLDANRHWYAEGAVPPALKPLADARRTAWRAAAEVGELLPWYADSIVIRADTQPLGDALLQAVQQLQALETSLELAEAKGLASIDGAEITRQAADLQSELDSVHRLIQEAIDRSSRPGATAAQRRVLERLALSAVPTWPQRQQIERALADVAAKSGGTAEPQFPQRQRTYEEAWPLEPEFWLRIAHYARCQAEWLRRVDPRTADQLLLSAEQIDELSRAGDSAAVWNHIQQMGQVMEGVYQRVAADLARPSAPTVRERSLTVIDPRDVHRLALAAGPLMPQLRVTLPASLHVELPKYVELDPFNWVRFPVRFQTARLAARQVALKFAYDTSRLEVRTVSDAGELVEPLPAARVVKREVTSDGDDRLLLEVRPRDQFYLNPESQSLSLQVTASADATTAQATVPLQPFPFQLQVERIQAAGQRSAAPGLARGQGVRLMPYSRRATPFELRLTQGLPVAQEVDVMLYRLPRPAGATWRPGFLLDLDGRPLSGLAEMVDAIERQQGESSQWLVAQSAAPIAFARAGQTQTVKLIPPAVPSAPATTPPAPTGTAPLPAAPPAEKPRATDGLLCRIRTKQEPQRSWWQWIEVAPLHPSEYLEPSRSLYDPSTGDFRIQLRLKSPSLAPSSLDEKAPITVNWLTDGAADTSFGVKEYDEIRQPTDEIGIQGRLLPKVEHLLQFTVDGYPRALAFALNRTGTVSDVSVVRHAAQISAIGVQQVPPPAAGPVVYLAQAGQSLPSWIADPKAVEQRDVSLLGLAAFSIPRGTTRADLLAEIRVDCPATAFTPLENQTTSIRVGLDPGFGVRPTTVFADRDWQVSLAPPDAEGRLVLEADVRELQLSISATGLRRLRGPLQVVNRAGSETKTAETEIALDEQPPLITKFQLINRPPITIGQQLQVRIEGDDLSTVAKAIAGLVGGNEDPAQWKSDTGKPMSVTADPQNPTRFVAEVRISTDQLTAGDFQLVAQLTDLAGNTGAPGSAGLQPIKFRLDPPRPASDRPGVDPNYQGPVAGITFVGSNRPLADVQVELKGGKQFPAQTTPNSGQFRFEKVPLGKYKLEAKGKLNNRSAVAATYEFQLEKPEDYQQNFNLKLEALPPEK